VSCARSASRTRKVSRAIWERISARFAENASGEVFIFDSGASEGGILGTMEEPILQNNPRVTKITYNLASPCG
jgi:hypothetical protein